jgi:hypothetical protein
MGFLAKEEENTVAQFGLLLSFGGKRVIERGWKGWEIEVYTSIYMILLNVFFLQL